MNIVCALRWRVTFVGVIFTRHCSPSRGTPFQVQVIYKRLTLIQDRRCEEGRHVALINPFVESAWDPLSNTGHI